MNDFDFEVIQKAKTARSAKHKKASARGPRGCSLPCDNLTPAQIRKLNGEPETYRLDRPLDWATFTDMPEDLQAKYIHDLQVRYGANDAVLAAMFGVSSFMVRSRRETLGVSSLGRGGSGKMNDGQMRVWQMFLDEHDPFTEEETQETAPEETQEKTKPEAPVETTTERMTLDCFTACITGLYSAEAMLAILGTMPIPEGKCTIRIEVTKV